MLLDGACIDDTKYGLQGFVGRNLGEPGLKPTVRVGEAAMREVAAFLLDYDQFAHVPNTVFGMLCGLRCGFFKLKLIDT